VREGRGNRKRKRARKRARKEVEYIKYIGEMKYIRGRKHKLKIISK
jgi:hypothetical protein